MKAAVIFKHQITGHYPMLVPVQSLPFGVGTVCDYGSRYSMAGSAEPARGKDAAGWVSAQCWTLRTASYFGNCSRRRRYSERMPDGEAWVDDGDGEFPSLAERSPRCAASWARLRAVWIWDPCGRGRGVKMVNTGYWPARLSPSGSPRQFRPISIPPAIQAPYSPHPYRCARRRRRNLAAQDTG